MKITILLIIKGLFIMGFSMDLLELTKTSTKEKQKTSLEQMADERALRTEIAKVIAAEAAGEGYEGMVGVANTIGNRSKSKKKLLMDVISAPNQYYGYTAPNKEKLYLQVKDQADEIADKLIKGQLKDNTDGAEYFLLPKEKVRAWHGDKTKTIGSHTFYREMI